VFIEQDAASEGVIANALEPVSTVSPLAPALPGRPRGRVVSSQMSWESRLTTGAGIHGAVDDGRKLSVVGEVSGLSLIACDTRSTADSWRCQIFCVSSGHLV
jgi:hypothetical protein